MERQIPYANTRRTINNGRVRPQAIQNRNHKSLIHKVSAKPSHTDQQNRTKIGNVNICSRLTGRETPFPQALKGPPFLCVPSPASYSRYSRVSPKLTA